MLALAQQYAALKGAAILAHRIEGREITFVLSSGQKLTMTESQLQLAISNIQTPQAGVAADGDPQPSAPSESAAKPRKTKKEG